MKSFLSLRYFTFLNQCSNLLLLKIVGECTENLCKWIYNIISNIWFCDVVIDLHKNVSGIFWKTVFDKSIDINALVVLQMNIIRENVFHWIWYSVKIVLLKSCKTYARWKIYFTKSTKMCFPVSLFQNDILYRILPKLYSQVYN